MKTDNFKFDYDPEFLQRAFEYWALNGFMNLPKEDEVPSRKELELLKLYKSLDKKGG